MSSSWSKIASVFLQIFLWSAVVVCLQLILGWQGRWAVLPAWDIYQKWQGQQEDESLDYIQAWAPQEFWNQEFQELQRFHQLNQKWSGRLLLAQVHLGDSLSFSHELMLDKGIEQGVKVDAPVLTPKGLVGRVDRVRSGGSFLKTLTHKGSVVAVETQKGRHRGLLKGRGDALLSLEFLAEDAKLEKGMVVLTSGLDRTYPKGIRIGEIESLTENHDPLSQEAIVRPFVEITELTQVGVFVP